MKIMTIHESMQALAKSLNKPCMYISWDSDDNFEEEICKAAPYLNLEEHFQILCDGSAIIAFDSDGEMDKAFNQTVGDEGPTKQNKYNGEATVYALTCNAKGEIETVNT